MGTLEMNGGGLHPPPDTADRQAKEDVGDGSRSGAQFRGVRDPRLSSDPYPFFRRFHPLCTTPPTATRARGRSKRRPEMPHLLQLLHGERRESQSMRTNFDLTIGITATDRASMEQQLNEAVTVASSMAMHERRRGILITRHSYSSFTVALSDAVPFGLTREHQDW